MQCSKWLFRRLAIQAVFNHAEKKWLGANSHSGHTKVLFEWLADVGWADLLRTRVASMSNAHKGKNKLEQHGDSTCRCLGEHRTKMQRHQQHKTDDGFKCVRNQYQSPALNAATAFRNAAHNQ